MIPRPDSPSADHWLTRCPSCGKAQLVCLRDVVKCMKAGGPKCCGRQMTWYVKAEPLPAHAARTPLAKPG